MIDSQNPQLSVLIPCYNEVRTLANVVRAVLATPVESLQIVLVDDGSTDGTRAAAESAGVRVVRHPVNLGKGRALVTGFAALAEHGADAAVCVDADGQHPPAEAVRLARYDAPRVRRSCATRGTRGRATRCAPASPR